VTTVTLLASAHVGDAVGGTVIFQLAGSNAVAVVPMELKFSETPELVSDTCAQPGCEQQQAAHTEQGGTHGRNQRRPRRKVHAMVAIFM
jgi:hypothetical protein